MQQKPVLPVHNLDITVPYQLGSISQYTDLPVYRDSPNANSVDPYQMPQNTAGLGGSDAPSDWRP